MRTSGRVIGISVGVSLAVIVLSGCSNQNEHIPNHVSTVSDEQQVVSGVGYYVLLSPEEHVDALFNTEIFSGTITSIGDPIRVSELALEGTSFEAVYTPVDILVSENFRGKTIPSETIRVRFLGGEVEGFTFNYHNALPIEDFKLGSEVLVFSGGIELAGNEPIAAVTPNLIMVAAGETLRSPIHYGAGEQGVDREVFLKVLRSIS